MLKGEGGVKSLEIEVTVNSKEENCSNFCIDLILEFDLRRFVEKDKMFSKLFMKNCIKLLLKGTHILLRHLCTPELKIYLNTVLAII
jgi:hypothetical protein